MRSFLPDFVLRNYRANRFAGSFLGSALFVDISGFTKLMETAFALGDAGAELMSTELLRVFDPSVEAVLLRGGTLCGFAGDAFTAVFPGDEGDLARDAGEAVIDFLAREGRRETPHGILTFNAKCGVDVGSIQWGICRDPLGRAAYYFRGDAVEGAATMEKDAAPGCVVGSPRCRPTAGSDAKVEESVPGDEAADVLAAFVAPEVLELGIRPEIKSIVSVFLAVGEVSPDSEAPVTPGVRTHEDLEHLLAVVRDTFVACHGTFNKIDVGDKGTTLLGFFGAPRAVETPARFALRLAAELRARLRNELPAVRIRAGMDHGMAYSGVAGGRRRNEWTCLGDCVNLSARLMAAADWDEVFVSSRVRDLGGRFGEFAALGPRRFKGKAHPEPVFRLESMRTSSAVSTYLRAMVGRRAELGLLAERLDRLHRGDLAGAALVYGEAGMGKTRLVAEFRSALEGSDRLFHWVTIPCQERDGGFGPLRRWLESYFGIDALSASSMRRQSVEDRVRDLCAGSSVPGETREELLRTLSFLAALVGCYWEDSLYARVGDPRLRYGNQIRAAGEILRALASVAPVVVEIEDVQWLEASTADWIGDVAKRLGGLPILFLATGRPTADGAPPALPVPADTNVLSLHLAGLDAEHAEEMFAALTGSPPDPEVLRLLMGRTGGNPFFLEQMVEHLHATGRLVAGPGGGLRLEGDPGRLPPTLESLLLARFDRLDAELREGLKHAATLGVRFLRRALEELLRRTGTVEIRPDQVVPHGEREGMLLPEERGPAKTDLQTGLSAENAYVFRHILMQQAAYHLQPPSLRTYLHGLAGETLEELFPAEADLWAEMAGHFASGDQVEKELHYLEKAAAHAVENYRNEEALALSARLIGGLGARAPGEESRLASAFLQRALLRGHLGRFREGCEDARQGLSVLERAASAEEGVDLAIRLRCCLADLLRQDGEAEAAWTEIQVAHDAVGAGGDPRQQAQVAGTMGTICRQRADLDEGARCFHLAIRAAQELGDPALEAKGCGNLGVIYHDRGDMEQAREWFQRSLDLAEAIRDQVSIASAVGNLGTAHRFLGDLDRALRCSERQLEMERLIGRRTGQSRALGVLGLAHKERGALAEARRCFEEQLVIDRELGNRLGVANALSSLGNLHIAMGEYDLAQPHLEETLRISRDVGRRLGEATALGNLGSLHFHRGDRVRARAYFEEHLDLSREIGDRQGMGRAMFNLGAVEMAGGRYEEARPHFQEYLEMCREDGFHVGEIIALLNLGGLYGEQEDPVRARPHLEAAFALAQRVGSPQLVAHAQNGLGALLVMTGEHREAVPILEEAVAGMQRLGLRGELSLPLSSLACALHGMGEPERAAKVLAEARRIAEETGYAEGLRNVRRAEDALGA